MVRRGLTLLELLVSMAIMAIILVVIVNVFIASLQFTTNEQSRIDVGLSASRIFSNLDEDLRQGRQVLTSATINGVTYTTSGTTLVLALPALVGGALTNNNDVLVMYVDNTSHQLTEIVAPYVDANNAVNNSTRPGGISQLTTNAQAIYFRYTTNDPTQSDSLTATLQTQQTILGRPFSQYAIINVTLRNHP